jgi:HD-GYP domain-containing protein (c-di-GMP phosphodiesterase class II)
MKFCLNDFLYSFAFALDCVERKKYNIEMNHTLRVAYMAGLMSMSNNEYKYFANEIMFCAVFHDNTICSTVEETLIESEKNIKNIFFSKNMDNIILYSHENIDGSGIFHKKDDEIPLIAQYIHLAHDLDTKFDLLNITKDSFADICRYVKRYTDIYYSKQCSDAFFDMLSLGKMKLMTFPMKEIMKIYFSNVYITKSNEVYELCTLLANIIDNQSHFTRNHSLGVASKAKIIAEHFHMGDDIIDDIYFAGAIHDIGKVIMDQDIIEKESDLTDNEFDYIQNHAYYTYKILHGVEGLEKITRWASFHHEKLDGSGYPFQLNDTDLTFYERLIACVDIYQALTEERPYKNAYSHQKAISLMRDSVNEGKIDGEIVEIINKNFSC